MFKKNKEIELAQQFLQSTKSNIFLTGKAGTGKTTFLHNIVPSINKRVVVAAPTAVAAINARGVTLHSLFQLPFGPNIPGITPKKEWSYRKMSRNKIALLKSIELLIIDEISMVRADLLDGVDRTLREIRHSSLPFGGIQLLMIGDVQQLSPIATTDEWNLLKEHYPSLYFFDSKAIRECGYTPIELKTIYRQSDTTFTNILNSVRENRVTPQILETLNSRYIPNFTPNEDDGYITLSTHNYSVNEINTRQLALIPGQETVYTATHQGDYPESAYPNDEKLTLKVGAQVIFIKNDPSPEKRYYNGMVATIVELDKRYVKVKPKDKTEIIEVSQIKWENIEYIVNEATGQIEEQTKGWFMQLPIRCAWAITIHKSQGLTFDKVIIEASRSFAHGQVYVALSRCRTLEGIILSSPLNATSIINDNKVTSFNQFIETNQPSIEQLKQRQKEYFEYILHEIFSFALISKGVYLLLSLFNSHLYIEYPKLTEKLQSALLSCDSKLCNVGENFCKQLSKIIHSCNDYNSDSFLAERLAKSAIYFNEKLSPIKSIINEIKSICPDSKEVETKIKTTCCDLEEELEIKECAIELCATSFDWRKYLEKKYLIVTKSNLTTLKEEKGGKKENKTVDVSADLIHPKLYQTLAKWRAKASKEINKPLFVVISNKTMLEIQTYLPSTTSHLKYIKGLGKQKIKDYGQQILEMVNQYGSNEGIDLEEYATKHGNFKTTLEGNEQKEKEKATKPKESATHNITLRLIKEGLSPAQIATERGFALSTIYGHIAKNIKEGELSIFQFMPNEDTLEIMAAIEKSDGTLTTTRALLNDKYSYNDIKLVNSHLEFIASGKLS